MTEEITKFISAVALVVFATPAIAAPHSSIDLLPAAEVMALGNPHLIRQSISADEASLGDKRAEDLRLAELSKWEVLLGHQPFTGMGVGGHTR